jgi:ubiquinone/menaquinone biosynthesis C-methylase UbiE
MKIILLFLAILMIIMLIRFFKRIFHWQLPFNEYFLDSGYRRRGQPPQRIIFRSGIKNGMIVLEVGCGSGTYTIPVAQTVGKLGQVYALDINPKVLQKLRNKLSKDQSQEIGLVHPMLENACKLPFKGESFDLVLMVSVLQEIPDQQNALAEVRRVLKPNGIFAVTEVMADPDYPLKRTTIRTGENAGFTVDQFSGNLWEYTVRFRKS